MSFVRGLRDFFLDEFAGSFQAFRLPEAMPWEIAVKALAETGMQLEFGMNTEIHVILPHQSAVRKTMKDNKKLRLKFHHRPQGSISDPVFSFYSIDTWLAQVLPTLMFLKRNYIFCVVESVDYDYRLELFCKFLQHSEELRLTGRLLWLPGPVYKKNLEDLHPKYVVVPFSSNNVGNVITRFIRSSDRTRTLYEKIYEHMTYLGTEEAVQTTLLILPSYIALSDFETKFTKLYPDIQERWFIYIPPPENFEQNPECNGKKLLILMLPMQIYSHPHLNVDAVIDSCLRRVRKNFDLSGDLSFLASKASIRDITKRLSMNRSNLISCICLDSNSWVKTVEYTTTKRTSRELASTILELEGSGIDSSLIVGESQKYAHVVEKLFAYGCIAKKRETESPASTWLLTECGRSVTFLGIPAKSAQFLQILLGNPTLCSVKHCIYIAGITAVWLGSRSNFLSSLALSEDLIKQTEFYGEDTLENALDIYLSFMQHKHGEKTCSDKVWCINRGVNYRALYSFTLEVKRFFAQLTRFYLIKGTTWLIEDASEFIESGRLNAMKKLMVSKMASIFANRRYVFHSGQFKSICSSDNEPVWTLDSSVELWVGENLKTTETPFYAFSRNSATRQLGRVVKCI